MRTKLKYFLAGLIIASMMTSIVAYGAESTRAINVVFNKFKLLMDWKDVVG